MNHYTVHVRSFLLLMTLLLILCITNSVHRGIASSENLLLVASDWEEVGAGSATWGGISSNAGQSIWTSIAVDLDGFPYIAWQDKSSGDYEIYVRHWNGSYWEEFAGSASAGGISNNGGDSYVPSIAIGLNNKPYIAWHDTSGGDSEIYIKWWNGSSWSEVTPGSASGGGISNNSGSSGHKSLAFSPSGELHIAWGDDSSGDWEIYLLQLDGNSWVEIGGSASGGGISDNSGSSEYPSLAFNSSGLPYVTWMDNSGGELFDYDIYIKRFNGGGWEEVGAGSASGGGISNSSNMALSPSIAISSSDIPYVAWDTGTDGEIYIKKFFGGIWVEAGTGSASGGGVSNNSGYSLYPSLVIASNNVPYLAWEDDTSGDSEIYVRRLEGSAWVEAGIGSATGGGVSDNTGSSSNPSFGFTSGGIPYVSWQDSTDGDSEIYVRRWLGETPAPPASPELSEISNLDLDGDYTVSWSSVSEADSFELQEEFGSLYNWTTIYTGSSTNRNLTDRTTGEWCYPVRAQNAGGFSGWSAMECVLVEIIIRPDTPTLDPISNPDLDGNYSVSWSNVSANAYWLQERQNGGSWFPVTQDGNGFNHNVTDQADGTWCYRVKAVNSDGESEWSEVECTIVDTTPAPPPIPNLYAISNVDGDGNFSVHWSIVPGAESYELQEQYYNGGWSTIYTGGSTNQNLSGRVDGSWCYRVRASNSGGSSNWSSIECTIVSPTLDPPPNPPDNLSATSISQAQIDLSWQDNSTDESEFRIERSPNGDSNWTQIGIVGSNITSYSNTGLTCDTMYFFRVKSYRDLDFQSSEYSNIASTITAHCSDPPPNSSINYLPLCFKPIDKSFEGPWEVEDNDSISQANSPILSKNDYYGIHDDNNDYFGFYTNKAGIIILDMNSSQTAVNQHGYPVIQTQLFYQSTANMVDYTYGASAHIEYNGDAGWYFIRIYTLSEYVDDSKQYSLNVIYP